MNTQQLRKLLLKVPLGAAQALLALSISHHYMRHWIIEEVMERWNDLVEHLNDFLVFGRISSEKSWWIKTSEMFSGKISQKGKIGDLLQCITRKYGNYGQIVDLNWDILGIQERTCVLIWRYCTIYDSYYLKNAIWPRVSTIQHPVVSWDLWMFILLTYGIIIGLDLSPGHQWDLNLSVLGRRWKT